MSKTRISEEDARCHFQDHKAGPRCCCTTLRGRSHHSFFEQFPVLNPFAPAHWPWTHQFFSFREKKTKNKKTQKIITCTFLPLWQSSAITLTRGCITNYIVGTDGWDRTLKTEALQNSSPACTQTEKKTNVYIMHPFARHHFGSSSTWINKRTLCGQWSRRQKPVDEVEMPKVKLNSHYIQHLLLPSTGPTVNSLPSTLRFRLTFISYANPVGRKTFVTGFNVQPSSFVSLLLCQTLWRGVFPSFPLCLASLL